MRINLNKPIEGFQAPKHVIDIKSPNPVDAHVGIVCAKFNLTITQSLLMGAIRGLSDHGVNEDKIQTVMVPGGFEVPLAVDRLLPSVDTVIAIACVIRGTTPHFDYVCQGITTGLTNTIHTHQKPVMFCVLTTNTVEEANERSIIDCNSNKGYEAAVGALEMIQTIQLIENNPL